MIRKFFACSAMLFTGILSLAGADSLTVEKNGILKIEDFKLEIVHFGQGHVRNTNQQFKDLKREDSGKAVLTRGKVQEALFTETVEKISDSEYNLKIEMKSEKPLSTLGLMLAGDLNGYGGDIDAGGTVVPFPAEYTGAQWVGSGMYKVNSVKIPLGTGTSVLVSGKIAMRIQDNRKFAGSGFETRFYFSPSEGELNSSSLELNFKIIGQVNNPVDIRAAANMGFADEVENDGKGGWTDQGPTNDLRMMKPGQLKFASLNFDIIDPSSNNGKSSIVLGRNSPLTVTVKNSADIKGSYLCLLHALGWPEQGENGTVLVKFKDGSTQTISVVSGRDVANWWIPTPLDNGLVAWSADNAKNYVGLYCSQFKLDRDDPVEFTFAVAKPSINWMIPAVTLATERLAMDKMSKPLIIVAGKDWTEIDFSKDIVPGSAIDFSNQLEAPAGKYGKIISKNGHLVFEKAPEKRIRLIGVNFSAQSNFLEKEDADKLAERLAMLGYNAARIHHQDGYMVDKKANDTVTLDPVMLDKLDYLFYALKKRGIYISTDIYVNRALKKGDNVPEAVIGEPGYQMKALLPVSKAAMDNWKTYARNWMTHRNPYTGMTWAEDPALYLVGFANENNVYTVWNKWPSIAELYKQKYKEWLETQADKKDDGRRFNEFMFRAQDASIAEQIRFMKEELKLSAMVVDNNMHNKAYLALTRQRFELADDHKYHDHPSFPETPWRLPMNFRQRSSISGLGYEVPEILFAARLIGKPFTISEYKFCPPNIYRAEGGPLIGAYAALQDWDGLYHYTWSHSVEGVRDLKSFNTFDIANDPMGQLSDRLTMLLFRRGDVKAASETLAMNVPSNFWQTSMPEETPVEFSKLGLIAKVGVLIDGKSSGAISVLNNDQLLAKAPLANPALEELRQKMIKEKIAISSTGELKMNAPENSFSVNSPKTESLSLEKGALSAGRLSVSGADCFQTLSVSSLDGKNIAESRDMLVMHMSNVANNKEKFKDQGMRRLEAWGELPMLLKKSVLKVNLKLDGSAAVKVEALKLNGAVAGPVKSSFEDGVLSFTADTAMYPGSVMLYRITR